MFIADITGTLPHPPADDQPDVSDDADQGSGDDAPKVAPQHVGVAGDCYSARNCSGKILNHRDAHNCKLSGGKSWQSPDGTCYNL